MTAEPVSAPAREPRLLTVAEYLALGETELGYDELVEGRVFMSPSPRTGPQPGGVPGSCPGRPQLPPELEVLLDLDVDLELAPPDAPGFSPPPDLIVARARPASGCGGRAGSSGPPRSSSPPSSCRPVPAHRPRGQARRVRRRGHPALLDRRPRRPVSLVACHLGGEFGYVDGGAVTGVFRTTEPFPVRLDLDALG